MDELILNEQTFRIKNMNAIQILAFRSQINFDSFEITEKLYYLVLESIEVKVNDKWLPVKEKGRFVYYPNGIENDVDAIEKLIQYFMAYLQEVFQKSNKLKNEQE